MNSFAPSVWMVDGYPYLQIHFLNTLSAMLPAFLLGIAQVSANLVKAFVIVRTYLFPMSDVLHGPNRSM
jgi:hypothetical protein